MRGMERSHSRGIDQAHVADDRNSIETRKHGGRTTWDDIATLKDKMGQLKSLIDSLPGIDDTTENIQTNDKKLEQHRSLSTIGDFYRANQTSHERAVTNTNERETIKEAREKVLASFHRIENPTGVRDIDQPKDLEGQELKLADKSTDEEPNAFINEEKNEVVMEGAVNSKEASNGIPAEEILDTEEISTKQSIMEEAEDSEDKEDSAGAEKQSKGIDDNVFRVLFSSSTNIRNMLGDQQFSEWRDIVNQDINNGKYTNAKYEDGLVYFIGNVNENSVDDRGDDWDVMKYRSRDERLKYDERIKSMDPKVWQQIGKTVYALGATLGDSSKEYHDALNKINQDIYSGRYETAEYIAVRNEGEESEEGVIVFNEAVGGENSQEEPVNKPETTESKNEVASDTKTEDLEPTNTTAEEPEEPEAPVEEPFHGEMTNIIKFEIRKSVDTLKKIYARLNTADSEQIDRFRYLYDNLSAVSKKEPLNKDEEQKKLDQIFAYRDLINNLYSELGGE